MASRSQTRPADQRAPAQRATAQRAAQRAPVQCAPVQCAPVQRAPVQRAPVEPEEEIIDIGNVSPCSNDEDTPAPTPAKARATCAGGVNTPDEEATCVAPIVKPVVKNSVRKSGSVRFFCLIWTDRSRNRLPIMARPKKTRLNRKKPV